MAHCLRRLRFRSYLLYSTDPWALQNHGLAWKELGKMEKAEWDWKLGQEIDPEFKVPV